MYNNQTSTSKFKQNNTELEQLVLHSNYGILTKKVKVKLLYVENGFIDKYMCPLTIEAVLA